MSSQDWVAFAKLEALRSRAPRFGEPGIEVHRACPNCGSGERWVRMEIQGDTPGGTDTVYGKLVAIPARRASCVMRCWFCCKDYRYGGELFTDEEQAQRNAQLWRQAKTGKVSL